MSTEIEDLDLKAFYAEIDKKNGGKSPFGAGCLPKSNITWDCYILLKGPRYSACPFCEFNSQCAEIAGFIYEFDKEGPSVKWIAEFKVFPYQVDLANCNEGGGN